MKTVINRYNPYLAVKELVVLVKEGGYNGRGWLPLYGSVFGHRFPRRNCLCTLKIARVYGSDVRGL